MTHPDDRPTRAELEAEEAEERLAVCLDNETHGADLDEAGEYCLLCGHMVDPDEPIPTDGPATEPDEPPLPMAA